MACAGWPDSVPVSVRCRSTSPRKNGLPSVVSNSAPASAGPTSLPASTASRLSTSSTRQAPDDDTLEELVAPQIGERLGEWVHARQLVVAIDAEHERRALLRRAEQVAHEQQRGLVGPLQVVEHERHRLDRAMPVTSTVTASNRR